MKQLKKTLLTLVALLAVTTGAWAQTETLLTTITATGDKQASIIGDIANVDAWGEVYECYNAGNNNCIWFTVEPPKFSPRDNGLFIRVAKLNRIHFYCLQHKVTSDAPTVEESSTNRIFDYGYRCGVSDDKACRQLALWIYGKFENEQDNEK